MLKNENIICISSIDWDFVWQGHQELMSLFAKNGNRVLFVDNTGARTPKIKDIPRIKKRLSNWVKGIKGIRKEKDNLYVFSPIVFPFPYSAIFKYINGFMLSIVIRAWMKILNFYNPIIFVFLPTPLSLYIVDKIESKKLMIYYCVDRFASVPGISKKIKKTEGKLLKQADLVFAVTEALKKDCLEYRSDVETFYFGVDSEKFARFKEDKGGVPQEISKLSGPIIGYVGGVHQWIDFELIEKVAELHPEYSIVMVGPVQVSNPLSLRKNIYFLGQKSHDDIPSYINSFSVCIVPYRLAQYTLVGRPTKLNEYLIMGKPVVSTNLPEVESFARVNKGIIEIAQTHEDFIRAIERSLLQNTPDRQARRIEAASIYSWGSIAERMSSLIESKVSSRKQDLEICWKDILADFYERIQKKISKLIFFAMVFYIAIFYTPLIWFLAAPLKISEGPKQADAIVVFGAGVGETGSPGKSTIERARYAAELYMQGLAPKIIFSSGYTYTYNDAENMKFFAISMGVPAEDIILEQEAGSAYENVKFSVEILRNKHYRRILLISSPYNMRRVSSVFRKLTDDIEVSYVPVRYNQFYSRQDKVRLEQIQGILHEYLGILYYLFKGYI